MYRLLACALLGITFPGFVGANAFAEDHQSGTAHVVAAVVAAEGAKAPPFDKPDEKSPTVAIVKIQPNKKPDGQGKRKGPTLKVILKGHEAGGADDISVATESTVIFGELSLEFDLGDEPIEEDFEYDVQVSYTFFPGVKYFLQPDRPRTGWFLPVKGTLSGKAVLRSNGVVSCILKNKPNNEWSTNSIKFREELPSGLELGLTIPRSFGLSEGALFPYFPSLNRGLFGALITPNP